MDKMLNRYFDKVVESEFNQQRMRSEQWRQRRTLFNSYMNLSPAERRRVSVSDMRGYQMQRIDDENVLLYSFEDNVVYNAKIDRQFNKIVVQSVNHKLSDMEKRAVFDNPFGYEPVSPYRIIFPTTQAGELQIVNLPGDLGASINEMKDAAEAITGAAQQMGDSINTFAQQNAMIHNDFSNIRRDVAEDGDPERTFLLWNDDNTTAFINGVTHKVKRGSQAYKDLVAAGRVERGRWMVKPEPQPVNVVSQITQEMDVSSIIKKLDEVIVVMNSFDIQVNLVNIYGAINKVAERINFLEDEKKGYPMMMKLLEGVQAKLTNTNQGIRLLSNQYAEVARSIATGDEKIVKSIGDLVNQQKAVIQESNRYLQRIETRLQGIENKPVPPAIPDIQALIPRQSEIRIDELTEFLKNQYNDFLKQWLERNSFIQQFVSAELGRAYEEINKRLVESFNRFTPLLQNVSSELQATNQNLIALGNAVENEGKATRQQLLDDTNALVNQLENGQTQTANLLTNGFTTMGNQLADNQTHTTKLLTDGISAVGNQLVDNQTHTANLLTEGINAVGNRLVDNQTQTTNLLTEGINAVGNRLVDNQTQTTNLLTEGINAVGNQTTNLLTEGINAVGNQLVDNQQAMTTRDQMFQYLYQQNVKGYQKLIDAMYQGYINLMNQQFTQPIIYLSDRQPEIVDTSRFTPQVIEEVNRAAALIDAYENESSNSNVEGWENDDTREDFIAFSSLLARNFNNPDFYQFANALGFSRLFRAYRDRNDSSKPELMTFFIRVANSKDLTPEYLEYMEDIIKRNDVVVDQSYEQYLRNTYNTIKDMFNTQGFNG